MSESITLAWLDMLGMTASIIAFIIAIYLQLWLNKKIKVRYVIGFIGIGFGLFLLTVRGSYFTGKDILILRSIGYLVFIFLEILGLREVLRELT